ncbi:MAG: hypothetical protein QUS14_02440 [Pyrinomonadaceae bacterium]|nr:hypothetical protein [Pyrinomonadaceae bacterium]
MKFLNSNCLSLVLLAVFAVSLAGQYLAGWVNHNNDQRQHGKPTIELLEYALEGDFAEAVFENWESEFLQMSAFVILTVFLFQKGSSESKRIDAEERVNRILPESRTDPTMPWPVRKGGWVLSVYKYSLSLSLLLLFLISFFLHGISGAAAYNGEQAEHGERAVSAAEYMMTSRFWFESLQNWQSEFLSIAVMVIFSIYLRQIGSPESKPVDTPHSETGSH